MSKTLPHDLEAEKSTLGAVIMHQTNWAIAASVVREGDFFREQHRHVFAAIKRLHENRSAIDLLLVVSELRKMGTLDAAGGFAYVASLTDGVPRSTNVKHYAALVRENARRREVIFAANKVIEDAYDAELSATDVVDRGTTALAKCAPASDGGIVNADDAIQDYVDALMSGTLPEPIPTGLADVDALLRGGLRPGDLVIVAARPSVGKTSLAFCIADYAARKGKTVLVFPIETGKENVAAKLLSLRSGVAGRVIEGGSASSDEWARVRKALETRTPIMVEDSARTATEVGAWCRRAKDAGDLHMAVVDYIQLMVPERMSDNESRDVGGISRALKAIAKELGIAMLAISQLSRSPEARRDKRPQLADLRSSGALEQDADVALLLHREEMHKATAENAGVAECIVAKQRNGPTGVVKLAWRSEIAQFANLADL